MSGELKSPRPVSSISPHTNKMRHNAQPGANTLCCVVPLFVLPCGEMMQSYKLMYNMKIFEILNFYKETLIRIHECGIRLEDVQYVNLYNDYIDMLAHGDKVSYIVLLLSEKYAVSERKVYSLIKHFQTDCISHAV